MWKYGRGKCDYSFTGNFMMYVNCKVLRARLTLKCLILHFINNVFCTVQCIEKQQKEKSNENNLFEEMSKKNIVKFVKKYEN